MIKPYQCIFFWATMGMGVALSVRFFRDGGITPESDILFLFLSVALSMLECVMYNVQELVKRSDK